MILRFCCCCVVSGPSVQVERLIENTPMGLVEYDEELAREIFHGDIQDKLYDLSQYKVIIGGKMVEGIDLKVQPLFAAPPDPNAPFGKPAQMVQLILIYPFDLLIIDPLDDECVEVEEGLPIQNILDQGETIECPAPRGQPVLSGYQ